MRQQSPDWIVRENDPYDDGYWARFDGKRRPTGSKQRAGWDACNRELADEAPAVPNGERQ